MAFSPIEVVAMRKSADRFEELVQETIDEMLALKTRKGTDYEKRTPVWHRMPFGDASWAQEVMKKADRLTSLVAGEMRGEQPNFESMEDSLLDIANYAIMWRAFLKLTAEQNSELTLSVEEESEKILNEIRGRGKPVRSNIPIPRV